MKELQDTQEFCNIFLDDTNNDLNIVKKGLIIEKKKYIDIHSKILGEKEFFDYFIKYENTIVIDFFNSEILISYICTRNFEHYHFKTILDIPLILSGRINYIKSHDLF